MYSRAGYSFLAWVFVDVGSNREANMEALNVERIGAFQGSSAQSLREAHFESYMLGHLKIAYT